MKTSELSGAALDLVVAKCEGLKDTDYMRTHMDAWQYSTDWALGGPIIDREIHAFDHMQSSRVCAIIKRKDMKHGGFNHGYGPTPLIAASKLGDEVDVPNELTKTEKEQP